MQSHRSGTYEVTAIGGERVRSFIPVPLPPSPDLLRDAGLQKRVEMASAAVGRLDAVTDLLPDPGIFIYSYVRREAVLSSQIEGTRSSLADLLVHEAWTQPGVPIDDVVETSNCVAALSHGVERLRGGFPISNRLIREVHEKLLASGRGAHMRPGEFRSSQNWVGGQRPGLAEFVPPPPHRVQACMADLERFIHAEDDISALVRTGLAHAQFETIHPFLDGNGRVGRVLISLMLCDAGLLREPLLYLSLYLKRHRTTYYELLNSIRTEGGWEAWLNFFLDGVREVAEEAVTTARAMVRAAETDRALIQARAGRGASSALRVHRALSDRLVASVSQLAADTGLTPPTVRSALRRLEVLEMVREETGRKRGLLFAYPSHLDLLVRGTELDDAGRG